MTRCFFRSILRNRISTSLKQSPNTSLYRTLSGSATLRITWSAICDNNQMSGGQKSVPNCVVSWMRIKQIDLLFSWTLGRKQLNENYAKFLGHLLKFVDILFSGRCVSVGKLMRSHHIDHLPKLYSRHSKVFIT